MAHVETVPFDGTEFGKGWQALAAAYFREANVLGANEAYDPEELGVPEDFNDACDEHAHFVEGVYAWIDQHADDPRLGAHVSVVDAPWVIEWAKENFLGRWDSRLQWADMILGEEIPESEWGVTWEHHIDWESAAREADVEFIRSGEHTFVFDNRGTTTDTPTSYREDWVARRIVQVGEVVLVQVYTNPAEDEPMRLPAKVRGKWQRVFTPTDQWQVAVELTAPFIHYDREDVVVFDQSLVYRRPPGRDWRPLEEQEVVDLPTVRVIGRRAVTVPDGASVS